ncbi:hypothetical protein NFI96_019090, partial [Prochilodus magdalenae]
FQVSTAFTIFLQTIFTDEGKSRMRFYSSALCALIFLISVSTVVSESNHTEVKVKLDDPATLPCHDNCSGSVSWTHNSSGVVAQCDRTSCSAGKVGYEMSHDQYLKGNLSLFIPVADSSKVGMYRCQCDSTLVKIVVLIAEGVKVKLDDPATLPSYYRCHGLVTWFHTSSGVVARCNRTSCSAVKEGYEMSYDQYLKGNLSLFIPVADSSKVGAYRCQCDSTPIENIVLSAEGKCLVAYFYMFRPGFLKLWAISVVKPQVVIRGSQSAVGWTLITSPRVNLFLLLLLANSVKVDLHGNATLPCNVTCSGVVTWIRSNYPDDILAQCNQTSCSSLKARYQMSYDQYQKGDFSLTITDAVYSMWDTYTCWCNGVRLLDVEFGINAPNTTVQIKPGGSLVLDVDVSDPVKVLHNISTGADGSSSGQICSLQCKPDYTKRAGLELRGMELSDSGIYIIRDSSTDEVIHVYTVSVREKQMDYSLDLYTYRVSCMVSGADKMV